MKARLGATWLFLAMTLRLFAETPCPQRTPHYVIAGNAGMIGTEAAEALICRDDETFIGAVEDSDVIEHRILDNDTVRAILSAHRGVTFRHCRIKEAIDIGHVKGGLTFESCDLEGAVRLNGIRTHSVTIRDSLFHQNFEVTDSVLAKALTVTGSVFTTGLSIDTSRFTEGILLQNVRVGGSFELGAVSTERCLTFERVRFLGGCSFSEPEVRDCVNFRACEWSRNSRVSLAKGYIGTVRFEACDFDGAWLGDASEQMPAQLRLSGMTIHSALLLTSVMSARYPTLKTDRCIIGHLKLPDWEIARKMVLPEGEEITDSESERESLAETLGVVRASYEREGRQRDAAKAGREYRLILARLRGKTAYAMNLIRVWTDDYILWIFLALISLIAIGYCILEERARQKMITLGAMSRSLGASWDAVFKGPDKNAKYRSRFTPVLLRVSRVIGAVTLFYVFARLQEWFDG